MNTGNGLKKLHLFSMVLSEKLVPPYEWPHEQKLETLAIIDGAEPLVPQLNAVKRFQDSVIATMREALASPASPEHRDLPFAELWLEAQNDDGRELHYLRYYVRPAPAPRGAWFIDHCRDDRPPVTTGRLGSEDPLGLAELLLEVAVRKWFAEVEFQVSGDSPASPPPRICGE